MIKLRIMQCKRPAPFGAGLLFIRLSLTLISGVKANEAADRVGGPVDCDNLRSLEVGRREDDRVAKRVGERGQVLGVNVLRHLGDIRCPVTLESANRLPRVAAMVPQVDVSGDVAATVGTRPHDVAQVQSESVGVAHVVAAGGADTALGSEQPVSHAATDNAALPLATAGTVAVARREGPREVGTCEREESGEVGDGEHW